ncbi:hypothetical protein LTX96_0004632 [Nakaseomyces glabratus]|nr:hypothetical protein LTX96_0004632 [Nakaseomyces glabratus]
MLIDCILKLFLLIGIALSKNPVELNNVCTFPNDYGRIPGFTVLVGRLGLLISASDYKELLRYPGAFLIATQDTMTTSPNFELTGFPFFTGLYGLTVFPLDLLVELRGYFVPPNSGQYTFTLSDSDDAAIIFLGNPSAFPCGDLQNWPKPSEEDITVTDHLFPSRTLYLIEGVAYPMRIAYYNGIGAGRLNAAFIDPSGTRHTNWEGYIWQYDPCSTCTYSEPPTATTIYSSGWVVSETTTGTSYSIYTGIDGVESTYRIFLVEVPTVTPSLSIPPITTVTISGPNYVEVEVISFVSTTNKEGVPVTGSTTINGTRDYLDADAPHNSLAPPPSPVTNLIIDVYENVTEYEVVSYYIKANPYGQYLTLTETITFKAPPTTVVEVKGKDYDIRIYVSYFITVANNGVLITESTTLSEVKECLGAEGISKLKSDLYNWAPTQLHFPNSTVSSRSIDSCTNECDKMDQNSSKVKNPNAKLGHKPDALSITQELYGEMPPNSSHMSIETFPTSLTSSRPNTIGESGASSSNLIMSNKLIDSVTVNEIFRLSTISSTNFNSTTTTRDSLANVALELISKLSPHKSDAFPATTPGNERNSNSLQPSRDDSSSIGNSLMHSRDTIQLYNNNQSSKPELYVSKTLTTHSEPATSGLISAEPPRSSIIFSPSTINLYSRFNSTLGTVISKYSTMSVSPSMNVSYSKQFNKTIGSVYYPDSQIINGCASGILNYWQCNFIFPILVLQLFFIL